jgi:hypothetical protein
MQGAHLSEDVDASQGVLHASQDARDVFGGQVGAVQLSLLLGEGAEEHLAGGGEGWKGRVQKRRQIRAQLKACSCFSEREGRERFKRKRQRAQVTLTCSFFFGSCVLTPTLRLLSK